MFLPGSDAPLHLRCSMYATAAGKVGRYAVPLGQGRSDLGSRARPLGLLGPQAARIDSDGGFGRFKLAGCRASLDRDWPPVAVDRFTSPIDWNGARVASLPQVPTEHLTWRPACSGWLAVSFQSCFNTTTKSISIPICEHTCSRAYIIGIVHWPERGSDVRHLMVSREGNVLRGGGGQQAHQTLDPGPAAARENNSSRVEEGQQKSREGDTACTALFEKVHGTRDNTGT